MGCEEAFRTVPVEQRQPHLGAGELEQSSRGLLGSAPALEPSIHSLHYKDTTEGFIFALLL